MTWNSFTILKKFVGKKRIAAIILTVCGYLFTNSLKYLLPLIYSGVLDSAISGTLDYTLWAVWFTVGILLLILQEVFLYLNARLKISFHNKLVSQLYTWYRLHFCQDRDIKGTGYYKNFIMKNSEQIVSLFDIDCLGSLIHTCSFIIVSAIIFKIDIICGTATLVLGVTAILFHRVGNAHYAKYGENMQKGRIGIFSDIQDTLDGAETVLSFSAQDYEIKRNKSRLKALLSQETKIELFRFLNFFVGLDFCKTFYLLFIMVRAFTLATQGDLTIALSVTLILYSQMTTNPIQYLNYALSQLQEGFVALKILSDEIQNPSLQLVPPIQTNHFERIELQNISFSYENKPILKNINIILDAGQHYHLKAASGKGKTTLLRILTKELKPQMGKIIVDGVINEQRPLVSFLLQSSFVFNTSLSENICFKKDLDNRAREFIKIMELEYLTSSDFSSRTLSGGEKSRILLARTLWHMKKAVILDEPLLGVDEDRKFRILYSISPMLEESFVLLVTHDESIAQALHCKQITLI